MCEYDVTNFTSYCSLKTDDSHFGDGKIKAQKNGRPRSLGPWLNEAGAGGGSQTEAVAHEGAASWGARIAAEIQAAQGAAAGPDPAAFERPILQDAVLL